MSNSSNENFSVSWSIENFHMSAKQNGEFLYSPTFYLKNVFNTAWHLELFPRGCTIDDKEFISYKLSREGDNGPKIIEIGFCLSANSEKFKAKHKFSEYESFGINKFVKRESISRFRGETFVVTCNMYFLKCFNNEINETQCLFSSSFLQLESSTIKFLSEVLPETETEFYKKPLTYPHQYHFRHRIPFERRFITYPIKDIVTFDKRNKWHIPVTSYTKYPSLLITLNRKMTGNKIDIEFCLTNELESSILLVSEIELVNPDNEIISSEEDEHLFINMINDNDSWRFRHGFKWSDMKEIKDGNIHFTLSISDDDFFAGRECSAQCDYDFTFPIGKTLTCTLSKKMFRLYSEQKLCDVTLQTKEKTYQAHKNVLAAMSPVFTAMFESGLKEAHTNVVCIEDLDAETVGQMLNFVYTETIERLHFESAIKLFIAADKYQITSLKDVCRNFLKGNFSMDTLSIVLCLADDHNDTELQKSIIEYIYLNEDVILEFPEWRTLLQELSEHPTLKALQELGAKPI